MPDIAESIVPLLSLHLTKISSGRNVSHKINHAAEVFEKRQARDFSNAKQVQVTLIDAE
jgi:hypothetical protein